MEVPSTSIVPPNVHYTYSVGFVREAIFPLLAVLASVFLPWQWIVYGFVIVGHAHFLMAYLYQYRGRRMNRRYFVVAFLTATAAFAYFYLRLGAVPILIFSGILFAVHFAFDEFTLHGEALSRGRIGTVVGFSILFSALVIAVAFPHMSYLGLVAGIALAALALLKVAHAKSRPSPAERYLWLVAAFLFVLAVLFHMPEKVLAVILLLHFANWYVGFGDRLKTDAVRLRGYWTEAAVTLCVPAFLYLAYVTGRVHSFGMLFEPQYYYMWAVAHIVLSFVTAKWRFQA